jgi:hypothetical protein
MPQCNRARFHVRKKDRSVTIRCEATYQCGWSMEAEEKVQGSPDQSLVDHFRTAYSD